MSDQSAWERLAELGPEGAKALNAEEQMELLEQMCHQATQKQLNLLADSIFVIKLESGDEEAAKSFAREVWGHG